ncbi:MAG: hypothetical protein RLZZ387_3946 [Chloroflexota bacterium]|jgi:hypothetical protein
MFNFTSRYAGIATATTTAADGREVAFVQRRFLPAAAALPLLAELTLAPGERLDLLTHRALGDPLQFWRIADANDAISPFDLEEEGRALRVPVPLPS